MRPRSILSALGGASRLALIAALASGLALSGASPALAESVPPSAAPTVEPTEPPSVPAEEPVDQPADEPLQTEPAETEPAEPEPAVNASIDGTVTVADGAPAVGVNVNAYRHNGDYFEYSAGAMTTDTGEYTIESLEPGTYTLEFAPSSDESIVAEWWDDRPTQSSADSFEVGEGGTFSGMDATLALAGVIEGGVSGVDGVPLPYASVTAYEYVDGSAEYRGNAWTGEDGAFRISGLPEGTYTLHFSPPWESAYSGEWWNDKSDQYSADTFTVIAGETVSGMLAELSVGGGISGAVTGADDLPLAGVTVSAMGSGTWGSDVSDADGRYEILGLPADSYTVSFQPDEFEPGPASGYLREYWDDVPNQFDAVPVVVGAGETVSGIDAELARAGSISGVVAADGQPIAGVEVSVSGPGWGWATTDIDGRYEVLGLPRGSYDVWFTMPAGTPYFGGPATVQVSDGETASLDYTPQRAASVSGLISVAGSDEGVPGATVTLHSFGGATAGTATTDGEGRYTIAPVDAGRYLLEVSGPGISTTWSGGSPVRAGAEVFSVAASSETVRDVAAPAGSSGGISGIVSVMTREGAVAAPDAVVELYTERGLLRSTVADADGGFRFDRLDAGKYAVRFAESAWSTNSWWWDGSVRDTARYFDVGSTETVTRDFTLPGLGWIGATIQVDDTFTGDIRLEAVDPVTGEVLAAGTTHDGSEYTLFDVPAGDVKVRFVGAIRDTWWGGAADFADAPTLTVPIGGEARADATLSLDTVLSGIVTGPDGEPLPGASVLSRPDDAAGNDFYTITDEFGRYRITGLEPGRYSLTSDAPAASTHGPVVVEIAAGVAGVTRDIRLEHDVRLTGTLTYLGQPVEGCVGVDGPIRDTICTDANGTYELPLRPGTYRVSFRTTVDLGAAARVQQVTVAPGQSGPLELDADLETGGVIEGRITADLGAGPEAIGGVWVTAAEGSRFGGSAESGADGRYRIWGLQKDVPYTVRFGNPWNDLGMEWWNDASSPGTATPVVPGTESITGIDAELTRGGTLSGRVVDAEGLGASFATVEVSSLDGAYLDEVRADIQGSYAITGLAAGDYKVRFEPSTERMPGYLPEWWRDAGSAASAAVVTVAAGEETSHVDAALNREGTVTVEQAAPQLSGTARVGETLTAIASSTTDGAAIGYEWLADDEVITGAVGAELVLTADQLGKRISIRVTASAVGYLPSTLTSPQSEMVEAATSDPSLPQILGVPLVGAKLTVDSGEKPRGTAFAYQWLADGVPITGATRRTLRLTEVQAGARIQVQVTTLRRGVEVELRTSVPTLPVLLIAAPTAAG
ncbi:carboxypeptidase regulatory-like domain-containing protein [Agromyces sp. SYSU K20354]|uniref:carboxypeptidase regulatory-like domain-containing protein n=1 Tax=Agromyces cavernae TaxID=2898659 RepID=UPI001E2B5CCD|nr:carboxypeptidase regulatory-like domain-containing protein [Agromyces cavernae]MCD2444024.1 carboxypeptidase regulatory-like domain-containing protein [Agromyces cavernae]